MEMRKIYVEVLYKMVVNLLYDNLHGMTFVKQNLIILRGIAIKNTGYFDNTNED